MVKQRPYRRAAARGPAALLPAASRPQIVRSRTYGELDTLLVAMPVSAGRESLAGLPEGARWQALHAREQPRAGAVRTVSLANSRQTLAVLGFLPDETSVFEQLQLAGRMLKATAERAPQTLGLAALGAPARAETSLEALLAAALSERFALPSYKSAARPTPPLRRIVLPLSPRLDTHHATISADGTNLARWLTALPPNMLDSRGYHSILTRLADRHGLALNWLDERALRRAGANAFLAVAAGNGHHQAGIAHLSYRPARRRAGAPARRMWRSSARALCSTPAG